MSKLARLRWVLTLPSRGYRGCEEIVNAACIPAVDALGSQPAVTSLYVSKHGPEEVWFTVFSSGTGIQSVTEVIESLLAPYHPLSDQSEDPKTEELLEPHCSEFRQCLDLMTRIALDVHRSTDLVKHQQGLISIGRKGRTDRALLEPYLGDRSETFRGLGDAEEFWSRLECNCLSGTDCVHWLYNVVLGFDWRWDLQEHQIAQVLGIPWPPTAV